MTYSNDILTAYGIPSTADTVQYCETWTGSDYTVRETTVGSAFNAFQDPDAARTVEYSGGMIRGYAADGGPAHDAVSVGPTAFDFMQVDDATRQASFDDPYWAVYSDGNGNPCPPPQVVCSVARPADSAGTQAAVKPQLSVADTTHAPAFARHGLHRRGLRALVDNATEISRSPEGHRRFRMKRGEADVVLTLDRDTELLLSEEATAPGWSSRTTHEWVKLPQGGFARGRTVVGRYETAGARPVHS